MKHALPRGQSAIFQESGRGCKAPRKMQPAPVIRLPRVRSGPKRVQVRRPHRVPQWRWASALAQRAGDAPVLKMQPHRSSLSIAVGPAATPWPRLGPGTH